jgi:hypothetical protein
VAPGLSTKEAPKIEMECAPPPPAEPSHEWLKWVLLIVLSIASATVAFFLIPRH